MEWSRTWEKSRASYGRIWSKGEVGSGSSVMELMSLYEVSTKCLERAL